MSDTDIHSCGYYCDRPACLKAQRDELRDKLFEGQAVKPKGVALTSIEHPHLGKPSKHKISKKSLEAMVLETEWVGLTYEDKKEIRESTEPYERETIIRLTEAKLKEKNT